MRFKQDAGWMGSVCCTHWQVQEPGQSASLVGVIGSYSYWTEVSTVVQKAMSVVGRAALGCRIHWFAYEMGLGTELTRQLCP